MFFIGMAFFVFSVGAVIFIFFKEVKFDLKNHSVRMKRNFDIADILSDSKSRRAAVIILFLSAIFLRWWQLGTITGGLHPDSAMAAIDAQALLKHGTDHWGIRYPVHMKAWGYGQQSALLDYLLVPVFAIFGVSDKTLVIPTLIISMIGIFALYRLTKEVLGNLAAVIALFIAAFNPWHFIQSRWAIDCNLFPHIFIIGLWLLIKGSQNVKYIYLSMIFFALSHYCYGVSLYIVPVFLLIYSCYLLKNKLVNMKTVIISILLYGVISLPFFTCMVLTAFKLPEIVTPIFTIPSFTESIRSGDILFFSQNPVSQLKDNFLAMINLLVLQKDDGLINTVPTFGTTYRFLFPFAVLGLFSLIRLIINEEKKVIRAKYAGIMTYLTAAFISGLITANVNTWRLNIIFYGQMLLITLGILFLVKYYKRMFIVVISLIIIMDIAFVGTYFTTYAQEWRNQSYSYHFREALEFTAGRECSAYYIVWDTRNMGAAEVSEADTMYVHRLDALYTQGKSSFSGKFEYRPYKEQYHYVDNNDMKTMEIDNNAVYIVNDTDSELLSEAFFYKQFFGPYCVGIPLKIYEKGKG